MGAGQFIGEEANRHPSNLMIIGVLFYATSKSSTINE